MTARRRLGTVVATASLLALISACSSSSTTAPPPAPRGTSGPSTTGAGAAPSPAPTGGTTSAPSAPPASSPGPAPATEFHPPGDIPDNQVYVDYQPPGSAVRIKVPEGWSRSSSGGTTTFSDHYNSIAIQVVPQAKPPTVATAARVDVPQLSKTVVNFTHGSISRIQRQHGPAVLVTYFFDSAANPVTGKVVRDAAQRYEFWHAGQEAVLTLTGPTSADNVDPWRLVSDSLRWG